MKTLKRIPATARLAALVMATLAGSALAGDLQVTSQPTTGNAPGTFTVAVHNTGTVAAANVRVTADLGHDLTCQTTTRAGHAFALGGALAAGDSVSCSAQQAVAGFATGGVFTASGSIAGNATLGSTSVTRVQSAVTDSAILQVVGGAEHQDTNVDGNFDAGEVVAYSYTVVNLGTETLNNIVVTDSYVSTEGPVTCPATTLAPGASMKCTRSHTVTAAEAAAASGGFTDNVTATSTSTSGAAANSSDSITRINLGGAVFIHGFKIPRLITDADLNGVAGVGDTLQYNFVVKNAGGQALTNVNITEPDPSRIDTAITCPTTTLDGAPFGTLGTAAAALAVGDSVVCTADYTITGADKASQGGQVRNSADLAGTPNFGNSAVETISSALVMPPPPVPDYVEVPVNSKWMLLALFGLLGLIGVGRLAWRRS